MNNEKFIILNLSTKIAPIRMISGIRIVVQFFPFPFITAIGLIPHLKREIINEVNDCFRYRTRSYRSLLEIQFSESG